MVEIVPFKEEYLDRIYEIELKSFSVPWSKQDLYKDALENKMAVYIVALDNGEPIGYAGMWHVVNEGHITNIAVSPEYRSMGVGNKLMAELVAVAKKKSMIGITLEVRMNNAAAQRLYISNGFVVEGIRKNYYADTKEDALIMWKYLR